MSDGDHLGASEVRGKRHQRFDRPRRNDLGRLPTDRATTVGQEVWPTGVDLSTCQPRPFAGVALTPARIDDHRTDTNADGQQMRRLDGTNEIGSDYRIDGAESGDSRTRLQPTEGGQRRVGLALPTTVGVPRRLTVAKKEDASGTGHVRSTVAETDGRAMAVAALQPDARAGRPAPPLPGAGSVTVMPALRLFAAAREAAGTNRDEVPGTTVGELLAEATRRYGQGFAALLPTCRVWVNGEQASSDTALVPTDEVAVLPPVSGG